MLRDDCSRDGEECCSSALAAELRLGANVEERPVAGYQMMRDPGRLVEDIDLTRQDVLCFLVSVGGNVARGTWLDLVEARCQVGRAIGGLCADAVGDSSMVGSKDAARRLTNGSRRRLRSLHLVSGCVRVQHL